jgi:hypothetical protein
MTSLPLGYNLGKEYGLDNGIETYQNERRINMYTKEERKLYGLRNKQNKSLAEWETLHRAGWADRSYNDQDEPVYILNEIGLAGGGENFDRELARDRRQGTGPL